MEVTVKSKSAAITPKQKEIMVEFIKNRTHMYSGKLSSTYTKQSMVNNWLELTNLLNSVPLGATKDWKQWRKVRLLK